MAVAAPRLDARFGDGGVARAPLTFPEYRELGGPLRPVRQADGKVLVAAQLSGEREAKGVVLARFGRVGALDKTFGRRGRVRIAFPSQFRLLTVLAQRDGRIVLVGTVGGFAYFAYRPSQLGILRLLPDGSRDLSFGAKGFVVWNPPWRVADARMDVFPGVALPQPDRRLLVAATVEERALSPGPTLWERVVLVRGSPAALRSTGSVRLGLNVLNGLTELVPTSDGALLMIGRVGVQHARGPAPAVRRILPDGSLDPTSAAGVGSHCCVRTAGAARPRQTGACSCPRGYWLFLMTRPDALRPGRSASGASALGRPWFSAAAAPCWERPSSTPTVWPAVWP